MISSDQWDMEPPHDQDVELSGAWFSWSLHSEAPPRPAGHDLPLCAPMAEPFWECSRVLCLLGAARGCRCGSSLPGGWAAGASQGVCSPSR